MKTITIALLALLIIIAIAGCIEKSDTIQGIKKDFHKVNLSQLLKGEGDNSPALLQAVSGCNNTCNGSFLFSRELQNQTVLIGCACLESEGKA